MLLLLLKISQLKAVREKEEEEEEEEEGGGGGRRRKKYSKCLFLIVRGL